MEKHAGSVAGFPVWLSNNLGLTMNFSYVKCVISAMTVVMLMLVSTVSRADATENFITLADIHFSPFVNCNTARPCALINKLDQVPASQWSAVLGADHARLSHYHQDTNYSLLASALTAAKNTAATKHAKFVIVLGDMLAHDYSRLYEHYTGNKDMASYQAFVRKTYQFLNTELSQTFPDISVYMVVGNNDSYHGDYATNLRGVFFRDQGRLWSALVKNSSAQHAMRQSFSNAGYYAVNLPDTHGVRLIVLNTNLFSTKARGENLKNAADMQLKWLHNQLADVKKSGQTAWIAMHIPEGIDVFSTLRIRGLSLIQFWRSDDVDEFQKIVGQFSSQVTTIFAGHLHSDWLQMLQYNHSIEIPVMGTPSISPVFGNNPGYKLYTYSLENKKTINYVTYYLPLSGRSEWSLEYQFNHVYGAVCQNCPITTGINRIHRSGDLSDYYKMFYAVSTNSQPIVTKWDPYYWCAIWHVQSESYQKCID